jgi:hypothetical protein
MAVAALKWRRIVRKGTQIRQKYGFMGIRGMKTTLELPDDLMRQVKLRAVHRNQKLKDAITQLLQIGIAAAADAEKVRRAPKPLRLKGNRLLTIPDIQEAIGSGRE